MLKRIRLLYLINSFVMGGAEKAMVRIISGLNKDKYDITVVSLQERSEDILPEIEKTNARIIKLSAASKYDLRIVYNLYKVIKTFEPEVLICSLFHSTILGRITGTLAKTPIVINWEHNENFGSKWRKLINKSTIKMSDSIFCDSDKVKSEAIKQLCVDENVVATIPIGGIDLNEFQVKEKKNSRFIEIGSVGMLSKQKGFTHLIDAARLVLEKNSNVRFSIAGNGPELENLQSQIDESKLSDKIKLLGFRRDIASLLGQWDIYVQPSLWEGLCMTVVEAMACGLPVIASNVGGVPESVIESRNGFLIPPGDKNVLVEKILELVEKPDLRIQMGRQGRLLAEKKYSLTKMCESIERIMDDLIKSRLHKEWDWDGKEWLPCISKMDLHETKVDILSYNNLTFQKDNRIENILSPSEEKELIEK